MESFVWPLKKSSKRVSQGFGVPWSVNPKKQHTGIDVPVPVGASVYAAASGTVVKTGSLDSSGEWAKYLVLEHDPKDYCTAYLHIEPRVALESRVEAGDVVASIAKISAPHLHFNVWRGVFKDRATQRGALPAKEFAGKIDPKTDPAFPSEFVDPESFSYRYVGDSGATAQAGIAPLFARDLSEGCSGPDVKQLQRLLNADPETRVASSGAGSPGQETESFGAKTKGAVQRFQKKHKIASSGEAGYGIVGPRTRAKLHELFGK
ncbi:MAG: peptidoglycan DD-metalloendopeptidase family protein [Vicinamibacteria bacterium]